MDRTLRELPEDRLRRRTRRRTSPAANGASRPASHSGAAAKSRGLDAGTAALASIHALAVLGDEARLRAEIRDALDAGLAPERIREAILQSLLFAGIPRAINGFAALRLELDARGAGEPGAPCAPATPPSPDEIGAWAVRGRRLFEAIYPRNHERVADDLLRGHPELYRMVLLGAYGQVLSRDALSARERELIAVAALVVLQTPRQLVAHIRGARYVGADVDEIQAVIESMARHVDRAIVDRALLYFERVKRAL